MNGKQRCKILKEIRREIAKQNDIGLVIAECTHKGDCRGTCPRCESEVAFLERELQKRRRAGMRVALAGICLGATLAMSGCSVMETLEENLEAKLGSKPTPDPDIDVLEGEVEAPYGEELDGYIAQADQDDSGQYELTGMIAPED